MARGDFKTWMAPLLGGIGSAATVLLVPCAVDRAFASAGLHSLSRLGDGLSLILILFSIGLQCSLWTSWFTRKTSEEDGVSKPNGKPLFKTF
jgi:hypothetical protein